MSDIPHGYCQCGCGGTAPLRRYTNSEKGYVKGQPAQYISGHNPRPSRRPKYEIDSRSECWNWAGRPAGGDYGQAWHKKERRLVAAHRLYYEEKYGPIPKGLDLDHVCRNRACVNPDHLEPVTRLINITRGRASKLAWEDVRNIRKRYRTASVTMRALAIEHNVSESTISFILAGKTWKENS